MRISMKIYYESDLDTHIGQQILAIDVNGAYRVCDVSSFVKPFHVAPVCEGEGCGGEWFHPVKYILINDLKNLFNED